MKLIRSEYGVRMIVCVGIWIVRGEGPKRVKLTVSRIIYSLIPNSQFPIYLIEEGCAKPCEGFIVNWKIIKGASLIINSYLAYQILKKLKNCIKKLNSAIGEGH